MTSEERREARYQRRVRERQEKRLARSKACGDFEQVFSFDNLFQSGLLCCKNVGWKCSTQRYRMDIVGNTAKTRGALLNGTYKSRGFYEFELYDRGKWRHIRSVHISERVVQRTLCDKVVSPLFQSAFIYDNAASIKGKGIDFAMDRLNCHLQRHYRRHGLKGGILVFDFTNYFGDAQHWTVREELARRVHDVRTRNLANTFLENFGPVGYGLGSQISQQAALMLPNRLDHVIKQELGIEGYGRYMDDGYLIHEDMSYLKKCLARIKEVCAELGIRLNERKTKIRPISHGIVFLKTKFILTETGRVLRKMSRASMRAMKRKLFPLIGAGGTHRLQAAGREKPCRKRFQPVRSSAVVICGSNVTAGGQIAHVDSPETQPCNVPGPVRRNDKLHPLAVGHLQNPHAVSLSAHKTVFFHPIKLRIMSDVWIHPMPPCII